MLPAQVHYWTLQEDKRSHLAQEAHRAAELAENKRAHLAQEEQKRAELAETQRRNLEAERQGWANIMETERSHKAQEAIGWGQIGLGYSNLNETSRHNRALEGLQSQSIAETARHQREMESIGRFNEATNRMNAYTNKSRAQTEHLSYLVSKETAGYRNQLIQAQTSETKAKTVGTYVNAGTSIVDTLASASRVPFQNLRDIAAAGKDASTAATNLFKFIPGVK